MQQLDVNKNGTIEFGEFLHWVALQCGMSTNERNKKRKRSDLHNRLQNLINALRKSCKILLTEKRTIEAKLLPLENGLNIMFQKYDLDNSGYLDVDEIAQLLADTAATGKDGLDNSRDADEILFALDSDHNGMVERPEFIKWVLSGLARPQRSRQIFASYSTFHQRMEDMLVGIEQAAMRDIGATFVESKVEQARLAEDVDGAVLENIDGEPASLFR